MRILCYEPSLLRRHSGFTLAEILVVLAIISVLAMITFGVFNRVQENSRSSTCQNHLRQIGMAIQQYVQDHDGRYPVTIFMTQGLRPYVKSSQIFKCPSDPIMADPKTSPWVAEAGSYWQSETTLQIHNHHLLGRPESTIRNAAETVMVWEDVFRPQLTLESIENFGSCGIYEIATMHFNGANHLFFDGHVKRLSSEQFLQTYCDDWQDNPIQR